MSALSIALAAYAEIVRCRPAATAPTSPEKPAGPAPPDEINETYETSEAAPPTTGSDSSSISFLSSRSPVLVPGSEDLVTTVAGVREVADAVTNWPGPVALDIETTALSPRAGRVRLIQIALTDGVEITVHTIDLFALPDPKTALAPLFAALGAAEVVGHNLQFDLRWLCSLGFVPGRVYDTMLASQVLHAGERTEMERKVREPKATKRKTTQPKPTKPKAVPKTKLVPLPNALADVVRRELGYALDKTQQKSDWSGELTPEQVAYAIDDAAVLFPLAERLRERLADAHMTATAAAEMRALPGIAWAVPITVDVPAWVAIADAAEIERVRLADAMDAQAPNGVGAPGAKPRNWNSPKQVKEAFAQVGARIENTTDDTLAGIDHPLAGLLREYRGCAKRVGTYGRKWVAKHVADGAVLPSWNQLGAESGRMSCSNPNLQQIPRESDSRRCFVARPGCVLVKADYSQIELRIAAKIANEPAMIATYKDGRDLHTLTAAHILNKPEADVKKPDRQLAKAVNFGLVYGMGWRGLKLYAKANYGVDLTDQQARSYRTAFFKAYPALQKWHAKTEADVKKLFRKDPDGTHAVYTLGGRRRILPVAKRDRTGKPYPNKTDALNTPVQGTGADALKEAVALLWEQRAECPTAVPVVFCHDEIVLEVPEADSDRAKEWLNRCMMNAAASMLDPVPVEVEVLVGPTWAG